MKRDTNMKIHQYTHSGTKALLSYEHFTFPGGEEHFRFNPSEVKEVAKVEIFASLHNSKAIVELLVAVDALRQMLGPQTPLELVCPYFPYARQDRVCVPGEAFGASVMAGIINSMNFAKVTLWDAHSEVSLNLLNRVVNIPQVLLLEKCEELAQGLNTGALTLVSPDKGATEKTKAIATHFQNKPEVIQAKKVRDPKTGSIVKTEIEGSVAGKNILIADDICDGGRTFIELAKVLKAEGAAEVSLYVTHGIFSKGLEVFEGLIDKIYTANSFQSGFKNNQNILGM